ncbi:UNVERIFIED_CONTAM: hypothetical protein Sradi_1751900 [Sesamum radiatum]|uniref:Histone deacetylase complex subunit SAP30 Sin3 binding domain-containing protein n=1 Tax=Sesamum radiatum TaxID=300843 RepID=A0AAW2TT91_SESRA
MLETEYCHSQVLSPFREESGDEELSVLPRHTKVIVTGNNRTKSVLVGLQGVVKKAVGLGGWHWLVLKNGVEVKLQRNALSVLEPPTGNEEDDDYNFDDSSSVSDIGEKDHHRISGFHFSKISKSRVRYGRPWSSSASTKSINRSSCREVHSNCDAAQMVLKNGVEVKLQRNALSVLEPPTGNEEDDDYDFDDSSSGSDICEKDHHRFSSGFQFSKISKPRVRYSRPWLPSVSTKSINRSGCREVQSKCHTTQPRVNLAKLGTGSLWRYWRSFHLAHINPNPTKEQLLSAIQQHFSSQHVDEVEVIVEFIRAAKKLQSVGTNRDL